MKKYILSGAIVLLIVFYLIYERGQSSQSTTLSLVPTTTPTTTTSNPDSTSTSSGSNPPSNGTTTTTLAPIPTPVTSPAKGQYTDGQYTGSAADAVYGTIQVKAIISGGKLTDVQFLQYPNDRAESKQISNMAMPQLTAEAVAAQNEQVDIVSGATQTSEAFRQSLASALSQAKS